ncbi:hypothetical protein FXO37_01336 [Capsicum annuum]|nr:hypothetical protein FXO37_01336 [Capsicum annuum]
MRDNETNGVLHSGRLFQQYCVDEFIKIETQRLDFSSSNQDLFRSDALQGLINFLRHGDKDASKIGKQRFLPAIFTGGPRDMRQCYMDAIALVQYFGKPDIFLTMTCNSSWVEIEHLLTSDEAQNRPNLISRVFKTKVEELKTGILKRNIFDKVVGFMYTIEFQKRLPHAHFLLILSDDFKLLTPESYDQIVSSELPGPDENPYLSYLLKKYMMHDTTDILELPGYVHAGKTCPIYSSALPMVLVIAMPLKPRTSLLDCSVMVKIFIVLLRKVKLRLKGAHIKVCDATADCDECIVTISSTVLLQQRSPSSSADTVKAKNIHQHAITYAIEKQEEMVCDAKADFDQCIITVTSAKRNSSSSTATVTAKGLSGRIRKLLLEAKDTKVSRINLTGLPGRSDAFELAANFCYGVNVEITISNVALLRCAARFMEMTEDISKKNLEIFTELINTIANNACQEQLTSGLSKLEYNFPPKPIQCVDSETPSDWACSSRTLGWLKEVSWIGICRKDKGSSSKQ